MSLPAPSGTHADDGGGTGVAAADEAEGIVLQWAKEDGIGWVAWTLYVVDGPTTARAIQEWLPADRLRPA